MNAEEKAAELERRIEAAVEQGTFRFDEGYLSSASWGQSTTKCEGCALAAAAFVLSGEREASGARCQQLVTQPGELSLTNDDAAQLEMGYEDWENNPSRSPSLAQGDLILKNTSDPFYKLGAKFREKYAPLCDDED